MLGPLFCTDVQMQTTIQRQNSSFAELGGWILHIAVMPMFGMRPVNPSTVNVWWQLSVMPEP